MRNEDLAETLRIGAIVPRHRHHLAVTKPLKHTQCTIFVHS